MAVIMVGNQEIHVYKAKIIRNPSYQHSSETNNKYQGLVVFFFFGDGVSLCHQAGVQWCDLSSL